MNNITEEKAKEIVGGEVGAGFLIGGAVFLVATFIIGVIDGITRPLKCHG